MESYTAIKDTNSQRLATPVWERSWTSGDM